MPRLVEAGWDVTAPSRNELDLRDFRAITSIRDEFDAVFHLAAWTQAGDWCLTHPGEQWIVNQQINTNVVTWWHVQQPAALFVGMGTSCSYAPGGLLVESEYMSGDPIASLYTYALTKRMLLQGLTAVTSQYGGRFLYLVPSTLYGPGYHTDGRQMHFIFDLARKILRGREFGEEVTLWGDGNQRRELVHVDDFITNLLALVSAGSTGVFNLGAGSDASIREFADHLCLAAGYPPNLIRYDRDRYVGARSKLLDVSKVQSELSSYVQRPLSEGLAELIRWFEESGSYR